MLTEDHSGRQEGPLRLTEGPVSPEEGPLRLAERPSLADRGTAKIGPRAHSSTRGCPGYYLGYAFALAMPLRSITFCCLFIFIFRPRVHVKFVYLYWTPTDPHSF